MPRVGIAGRSLGEHELIVPCQQIGWTITDCEATRFTKPRLRKPATDACDLLVGLELGMTRARS
jgi:hypothetical protein